MQACLLALCAMLALAAAGPVRLNSEPSDSCAITCKPGNNKFRYAPGQTYVYDYMVQTETAVDGASEERAILSINGQVNLEVIDQCEMALLLKDVQIHVSSKPMQGLVKALDSQRLNKVLQQHPLRFSFQDGKVDALCPSSDEDPWALNVKRGILSALQNSMDFKSQDKSQKIRESDVSGHCDTHYELQDSGFWGDQTIKRHKDLKSCSDRQGYLGGLHTTRFAMEPSGMQSLPLLNSDHDCQQVVGDGIVKSSHCSEKHVFRPFSADQGGVQTTVSQQLTFKEKQRGISSDKGLVVTKADMTFDHDYNMKDSSQARARAETLLVDLCKMTVKGVQPDVPRTYTQLVGAVRKLDSNDIREVYRQLQLKTICRDNNDRTKKFFLDSLPMAASSEAVELMTSLMISGEVSGVQADLYLVTLAFIPQPTTRMMDSVKDLVEKEELQQQSLLAVSSMVHSYCQSQSQGCRSGSVDAIMEVMDRIIGYRCNVNDGNIKKILTTLSAIGNTGHARASRILTRCLGNRAPLEVRVAAARAYRRLPCDIDRRPLEDIVRDQSEDSEVRIESYLQVMTCPSRPGLQAIQIILQDEPEDSQVGSFIHSHLSNLKETASPLRQEVRQMLQDVDLSRQFGSNPLKFSRNYEKSAFLRLVNSGGRAESNIIFSPQSPVPRSVSANLTVDVLGHSINLLEVGARLEGMEYLIESLQAHFFPNGKDTPKSKLDELKGSGYARVFGNELLTGRFQGLQSLEPGKSFNVLDFLIKLSKDHDYSFTQSLEFLDSAVTTPTVAGLPLSLCVNGSATVDVKASGKMDLRKVSKSPRTLHVEGEIRPSGAVNVDGLMWVDGLVAGTGLKVSSSLTSNLVIKGRVELDRGRTLNLQLDIPDDRMDIIDVRTKFYVIHDKAESEQLMITDNRREHEMCTGEALASMTGLELCGQLQFPNASLREQGPYFPFTGPSSFSLVLHKRDSHSGYKLLAKRVENKRSSIAQLSFDTPGSSVERAVSFDMMINYPQKEAEISFASPWKKTSVKGSLVSEPGLKSLMGSMVIDDDRTYSMITEIKIDEQDGGATVYTPNVQIRRPGADDVTVIGDIRMEPRFKQVSSGLTLSGLTKNPLKVQGSYTNKQSAQGVSGSLTLGKRTWSGEAGVTYTSRKGKSAQVTPLVVLSAPRGELLRLEGQTDYRSLKSLSHDHTLTVPGVLAVPVNLKGSIKMKNRKKGPRYDFDLRLKSKPFTGKVQGTTVLADTAFTKLKIDYNGKGIGREHITVMGKFTNRSTGAFKKYIVSSTMDFKRHPDWNIDATVDLEHKKRRSGSSLTLILGKDRKNVANKVNLAASMVRNIKSASDASINYKMKAVVPMMKVDYSVNGAHSHSPSSLSSDVTFKYGMAKGQEVKAEVNLAGNMQKQKMMDADARLSFPDHSYEVDSSLRKKGKQMVHTLNMKTHQGPLMTMTSTYKPAKDSSHGLNVNLDVAGLKPIKMTGTLDTKPSNLNLQGQALYGKDSYSLKALSKVSKGPHGKWVMDVSYPSRSLGVTVSGGLQKSSADLDFDLAWDKTRDDSAKVSLSMFGAHKDKSDVMSTSGKLEFSCPWTDSINAAASLDSNRKEYALSTKVSKGPKSNSLTSTISVLKPLSPSSVQMTWTLGTPIRGWKRQELSLSHSMDDERRSLDTLLKASRGQDFMQVKVTGRDKSRDVKRDVEGKVVMASSVRGLEEISLSLKHTDDGSKYSTNAVWSQNKNKYSAELDMTHKQQGWQGAENSGSLTLSSPVDSVQSRWQHNHSPDSFLTSITSSWAPKSKLQLTMSGNKSLTDARSIVNGALSLQTPWRSLEDLDMTFNTRLQEGSYTHRSSVLHNGDQRMSAEFDILPVQSKLSGRFSLKAPYMESKSGSAGLEYGSYPVTMHAELNLQPGQTITVDSSASKSGPRDLEGSLRVSTPFPKVGTVTISGSTRQHDSDIVAKANLDYGPRHNYNAVLTLRPESWAVGRLEINTPHEQLSSLDVGYQFTGHFRDLSAAADFTLQPIVGKYTSSLAWTIGEELTGKLRITTPLKDMRYAQITASSKISDPGRRSRIELVYHPRNTYSLTNFYTTQMPLEFSLSAQTPIAGYDSMGLLLKHEHTKSSISTHGELQYLPDKVIDATLTGDWKRNVQGSLLVKTPFQDFEESKISVRHDGELDNFKTHAEIELMGQVSSADAQFKLDYATTGSLVLETPLKGLGKVEAGFSKRGTQDNFRSSASIVYGDKTIEGTLNHRLTARVLKTTLTFNSPLSEEAKASVDMSLKKDVMQAVISGMYGARKVDSSSSLTLQDSDLSASSSLTYNLDGSSDQKMQASFSKKMEGNELQASASLVSPFNPDVSVIVKHSSDLPHTIKTSLSASAGKGFSISSDNSLSIQNEQFSASSVNTYRMKGPLKEASLTVRRNGDIKDLSVSMVGKLDQKEVSVEGELKTETEVSGKLQMITPLEGYEKVGLSFSHVPEDKGFRQQGSLTYKTDKTVEYSLVLIKDQWRHVEVDASLKTPFRDLENNVFKFKHDAKDQNSKDCSGRLEILAKPFGHCVWTYEREGALELGQTMTVKISHQQDDRGKTEGQLQWEPLEHGYRHQIMIKAHDEVMTVNTEYQKTDTSIMIQTSADLPPTQLSFEAAGTVDGFNVDLMGKVTANSERRPEDKLLLTTAFKRTGTPQDFKVELELAMGEEKIVLDGSFKNADGWMNGLVNVKTPLPRLKSFGSSFKHTGDKNRFTFEMTIHLPDEESITAEVSFYRYQYSRLEVTAEITSNIRSFRPLKVEYRHSAAADSFTCFAQLQDGDRKGSGDLRVTLKPKYDVTLTLSDTKRTVVAKATMENLANTHSVSGSLDLGNGRRVSAEGSLGVEADSLGFSAKISSSMEEVMNAQISGSYAGKPDDFTASLTLNSPRTDAIKLESALKYASMYDISASVALSSEIENMRDLRLEVRNEDLSSSSKNGHVLVRWAPEKQVSVDGSYVLKELWYDGRELTTDITVTSPFPQLSKASLHVQYDSKDKSHLPKVELTVNGKRILDADVELDLGDNPSVSLLSRSPRATKVTASLTRDGSELTSDLYVDWDRDQNDQNVRVQTKAKDIRDDYQTNLDYSLKVIHPSLTVSTGVNALHRDNKLDSEGFISWDDRSDRKLFYTLHYNDHSSYHDQAHDGSLRLGAPGRTLEAAGSYSKARQTTSVEGSFSWDADRDMSKQVGLSAKVTSSDMTKADLSIKLPAIGKEVKVEQEMTLMQGRTMMEGRTALSYSPDASKTLTVISTLKDISDSPSSGKNYSLSLSISHPHTNLDVSMTSHIGAVGDRLSAAMDTVYLTSRHTRKNMMLRGEIDRLRRQIDLQLDSPLKKMALHGEVRSSEPYILEMTNTYDDNDVIRSQVQIDVIKRSLQISTNYDLDNPRRQMVVKAGYVNASAISADLILQGPGSRDSREGHAILRLDTPTLLHAGLFWRPQAVKELQDYMQRKTTTYSDKARQSFGELQEVIGQELSEKYAAFAEEFKSELSPLVELLDGELHQVGKQMDRAQRKLTKMYRKNDFYLKDMGDVVEKIISFMKDYSSQYKEEYMSVISKMRSLLDDVTEYNIRQRYDEVMEQIGQLFQLSLAKSVEQLQELTNLVDGHSRQLWSSGQQQWEQLKNHPRVQHMHKKVQRLGQDYRWLMGYMTEKAASMSVPERYASAIYQARDDMVAGLNGITNNPHVLKAQSLASKAFQQGAWAYKYWDMDKKVKEGLEWLGDILQKLTKSELAQMTRQLRFYRLSNLTVYELDQGRIEAEIALPFRLNNLQEMPDWSQYYQGAVNTYIPVKSAVLDAYEKYYPWAMGNNSDEYDEDIVSQFEAYRPEDRSNWRNRRFQRM